MRAMRIGYPCINYTINGTMRTFRIRNYSISRHREIIAENLINLQRILEFNRAHQIQFFRISSQIIPFASHAICQINWQKEFKNELDNIGIMIKQNNVRISMHPDQFIVLNSPQQLILNRSIAELIYHAEFLGSLGLNQQAKIQIHVGGVYQSKDDSIQRFCENYQKLPTVVKKCLVIENDDHLYSVQDCYRIYGLIKIPIIFDNLYHQCFNNGESVSQALALCLSTWKKEDGKPMVDYSEQQRGGRLGKHAEHLNQNQFMEFLLETKGLDYDLMLEIKDKEKSVFEAQESINNFV